MKKKIFKSANKIIFTSQQTKNQYERIYGDKIVKKFCKLNHIGIRNPIIEKKKKKKKKKIFPIYWKSIW